MSTIDPKLVVDLNTARNAANCHTVNKALMYYEMDEKGKFLCGTRLTRDKLETTIRRVLISKDWDSLRKLLGRYF